MSPAPSPLPSQFMKTFTIEPSQVRYCHIKVEGSDKPVAAIEYKQHFYSFFRAFSDWSAVEKVANRMSDSYVITVAKKGWVLWAYEY